MNVLKGKNEKREKILKEGFLLFQQKGTENTSIQEIVDHAGVAKGTFYLYFKDKYDLQEQLIIKESYELFHHALEKLEKEQKKKFDEQIIFIINEVIDELIKNQALLKFISKNLSFGLYSDRIPEIINENHLGVKDLFLKGIKENNIKLKNPEITLFMIIELVGSTCFSVIIKKKPIPMEEYKPFLYNTIRKMINE